MSASCSMAPDSRRSESIGGSPLRFSTPRFSCESATTGHSSSFASDLSERLMVAISCSRDWFDRSDGACMSCR